MERQDVAYLGMAILIVLIVALFVKPALNGEEIELLSFLNNNTSEKNDISIMPLNVAPTQISVPVTPTPTPTPGWDGSVQVVKFVDPSTYHLDLSEYNPSNITQPVSSPPDQDMITFATISGRWSGTTKIITIPYPYWELHYTATELTEPGYVFPSITIQVMDANNPNRVVRIIKSGVLDPRNWNENDPRPWSERFFEGERDYYFVITTRFVKSYDIEIKVPKRYVGS
jgi:hypothetical protein